MKCALEMVSAIIVNEEQKRIEKEKNEALAVAQAMEDFVSNKLATLDTFVENALLNGKGKVNILIDTSHPATKVNGKFYYPEGFVKFVEKNYSYKHYGCPYWSYSSLNAPTFPLDFYIEYLKNHCYDVKIEYHPFEAYSSSGKSMMIMEGKTLCISIPNPPCV